VRKQRAVFCLAFLLLVEACTLSHLAWNNAEWLAMYQLDHYFDLSRKEENLWRPKITALVTRLQDRAGPELVVFLQRIREAILDGLTEESVVSLFREWDDLRVRHFSSVTGEAAEFLSGLDEANVGYLRKRLADSQKREENILALNDGDYAKNRVSHARKQVERYYGRITAAQAKAVGSLLDLSRRAHRDHMTQTQDAQRSFLAILGRTLSKEEIRSRLDQWVRDPAAMRTTERCRLLYIEERRAMIRNIVAVDRLMTQEQRKYLIGKLDGWTNDLRKSLKTPR
jgi:hypothetical protein